MAAMELNRFRRNSSRSDPERAQPTASNHLTSAKTFNDLPAPVRNEGVKRETMTGERRGEKDEILAV